MISIVQNIPSLSSFIPELVISTAVLIVIIISVFDKFENESIYLSISALFIAAFFVVYNFNVSELLFAGLIITDQFSNIFKLIIIFSVICIFLLTFYDKDISSKDWPEFCTLILLATLGMFLMSTSINLLMVYLAIELVSIPSYILAGFNFNDKKSNEASIKYVLYGSFASGLMLFGMSWLYGQTGSLYFHDLNLMLTRYDNASLISIISFIFIFAGMGYKISSAPFHYWVPDVYQGAPISVTSFFAVAPKVAGLALLIRFLYFVLTDFSFLSFNASSYIYINWNIVLGFLSAVTMTIGNVLALRQDNIKRILAYSSISHVGFIMMALATISSSSIVHMIFYIVMYMFMTLGAFSVAIFFHRYYNVHTVDDLSGLGYLHPFICSFMVINLMALSGLPPTSGFVAKFYIFASIIESKSFYWLAVVAVINTVISLYYYFNLARSMFLEKESNKRKSNIDIQIVMVIVVTSIQGIIFYFYWSHLYSFIKESLL